MIDKRTVKLLQRLNTICNDGSYKIIEKAELDNDTVALEQNMRYLQDNELIDVKYSDEKVYCLNMLPRGRVTVENVQKKLSPTTPIRKKSIVILGIICFVAGFVGALVGAIIGGLL